MLKSTQLQIRLSPSDKRRIEAQAKLAGMPVSSWVLARLLPHSAMKFRDLYQQLATSDTAAFLYAEFNDFLSGLDASDFATAVVQRPDTPLDAERANYLAAMIEHTAAQLDVEPPAWTRDIAPLREPMFTSSLLSLRLHLLVHGLPAFKRRNLFVDSSVGARV